MGGGDLNLKKSWHTQTLSNIEEVWKREQEVERLQKLQEQRQKQLKEERAQEELRRLQEEAGLLPKRGPRLDWMYAGTGSQMMMEEEREAYLMGKKRVDGILEQKHREEQAALKQTLEAKQKPSFTGITSENEHRDMQAKIREDPLFAIRQREKETIDRVLKNPLKVRQIRDQPKRDSSDVRSTARSGEDNRSHRAREHHDRDRHRAASPGRDTFRESRVRDRSLESRDRRNGIRRDSRTESRHRVHDRNRQGGSRVERWTNHVRHSWHSAQDAEDDSMRTRDRRRSRSPRHSMSRDHEERHIRVEEMDSNAAEAVRQRKLEAMRLNARDLRQVREARVREFEAQEAQEQEELARRTKSDPFSMVPGSTHGNHAGSSMSMGALHDRLRQKLASIQRHGDGSFLRD